MSGYPEIILASKSPRRKELLELLGLNFRIVPADIDERKLYDLKPEKRAEQLSLMKAKEVAKTYPEAVIISADSFGVLDGEILEKSKSEEEAFLMLEKLSGNMHQLITGFTVYDPKKKKYHSGFDKADIIFHELKKKEIEDYLAADEYEGKAPPYTISGKGIFMVREVRGCYHTVTGLPLEKVSRILLKIGVNFLSKDLC